MLKMTEIERKGCLRMTRSFPHGQGMGRKGMTGKGINQHGISKEFVQNR